MTDETCGRCGAPVRIIRDAIGTTWAHVEAPASPHRPILGTPAATIQRADGPWTAVLDETHVFTQSDLDNLPAVPQSPNVAMSSTALKPEVMAEAVELDDPRVPRGARSLTRAALAAGNDIRVTYSRGPYVAASGRVLTPQASNVMVKVQNVGVACWVDRGDGYKVDTVFAYRPLRTVNVTELTILVKKEH